MLKSQKPIVAVCAVRTGCGKSQTTRKVCSILRKLGRKVVVVRHPMPYGDLRTQAVQRFSSYDDFERHQCTIEEREEYEPLVDQGIVVYAGVDYGQILNQEEKEAEGKRCQLLEARRASFGIAWSKPWIYQKRFRLSEKGFRQQPVTTWHFDKPVRYLAWCRRE